VSNSISGGTGKGGIAMFDRLIESDSAGADFKPRRRYFVIATVVIGILFISAVVVSLYATDIGLGNDSYELTSLLAPVQPPAEAPEPPQPQRALAAHQVTDIPIRVIKQQPIDVTPVQTPPISVTPNRYLSLPPGPVEFGPSDSNVPSGLPAGKPGTGSGPEPPSAPIRSQVVDKPDPDPQPPKPAAPARTKTMGVVNGYAITLPKPPYPPPATAMNVQGKVDVQIMIDEYGNVISAKAVDGHPLLRAVSEQAALKAKFKPTTLSLVPVKVTGVIVYNFTRN
jgi:protein TonB